MVMSVNIVIVEHEHTLLVIVRKTCRNSAIKQNRYSTIMPCHKKGHAGSAGKSVLDSHPKGAVFDSLCNP